MALIDNGLIDKDAGLFTTGAAAADLSIAGNFGGITNHANFLAQTPYVKEHARIFIITYPRGFDDLDDPDKYKAILKELIETRPLRVEGIKMGNDLTMSETPYGADGQKIQMPTNSTYENPEPTFTLPAVYGDAVVKFYTFIREYLMIHPVTKKPAILADGGGEFDGQPDYWSFSFIAVEPAPNGRDVVNAIICYNCAAMGLLEKEIKFDPTNEKEANPEVTISFSAIGETGQGVIDLAVELLAEQEFGGLNPSRNKTVHERSADVDSTDAGVKKVLDEAASLAP